MFLFPHILSVIPLHKSKISAGLRAFIIALVISLPGVSPSLFAQASLAATDAYQAFYDARQWFGEGNYSLSYPVFKDLERRDEEW
jgi:hypothetical protein